MTEDSSLSNDKILCACGHCNETFYPYDKYGRPRKYKWGHNAKGKPAHPNSIHAGPKSVQWKGGITKRPDGYIMIKCPEHPRANKEGRVLQHIVVMEEMIGRYLRDGEVVHHINGNRSDNRKENLKLFASNGAHLHFELTKDMSERRCCDCGSAETYGRKWNTPSPGIFLCGKCYAQRRRDAIKMSK